MSKKLVITIGHILMDLRLRVTKLPDPDEEAEILEESRGVGGSAANVAIALRKLGIRSGIIAKVGLDSFGRIAVEELIKNKVEISGLGVSIRLPTGFSIVAIDQKGNIAIYSYKGAANDLRPSDIHENVIKEADYIHVASLRPEILNVIVRMKNNFKLSWDPGRVIAKLGFNKLKDIIAKTDILLVNEEEASYLSGKSDPSEALKVLRNAGARLVIAKLGSRGSLAFGDFGLVGIPSCPVKKVIDTTGAGDSYAAGLLASLVRGFDILTSLKIASTTASLKVSKLGSHEVPSFDEVLEYAEKKRCL